MLKTNHSKMILALRQVKTWTVVPTYLPTYQLCYDVKLTSNNLWRSGCCSWSIRCSHSGKTHDHLCTCVNYQAGPKSQKQKGVGDKGMAQLPKRSLPTYEILVQLYLYLTNPSTSVQTTIPTHCRHHLTYISTHISCQNFDNSLPQLKTCTTFIF